MYVYVYTYMNVTTNKGGHERSKSGYMGEFGGKGRGKWCDYIIFSKITEKKKTAIK